MNEVARIEKNGEEIAKNISHILQFIESARFMTISLSYLVNNLFEGIHKINGKYGNNVRKYKTCKTGYKYCDCFLEYTNFKDDLTNVYVVTRIIIKSLMKS